MYVYIYIHIHICICIHIHIMMWCLYHTFQSVKPPRFSESQTCTAAKSAAAARGGDANSAQEDSRRPRATPWKAMDENGRFHEGM